MFKKALGRAHTRFTKYTFLTRENIAWSDFVRPARSEITPIFTPFSHIVVDDFLKEWAYQDLLATFRSIQSRGYRSDSAVKDKFHSFNMDYDGYVFTPIPTLDPKQGLSLFFSLEWNLSFSKFFKQDTTFETSVAFHHHPVGDRTGFVHHDFTDKPFTATAQLPNGVVPFTTEDKQNSYMRRRIVALIFFLGNEWIDGDGGEVGLYAKDKKTLVTKVAPRNNRLFAFQISPHSFHAFQQNYKDRNSIVQWFHVPSDLL